MQFKAGYILEAVKRSLNKHDISESEFDQDDFGLNVKGLLEQLCTYDVFSKINLDLDSDPDSILAVAYNLITRGQPAFVSPFLEEYYSNLCQLTKADQSSDATYEVKFVEDDSLSSDLIYRAMHPIDPSVSDRNVYLNLNSLDSDFERNFLLKMIPSDFQSLAFVLEQQRARNTLGAGRGNQGRVDFSLEVPYFNIEARQNKYKQDVEVKNRKKYIIEVDGSKYHQQLTDDLKDFEVGQFSTNIKHVREDRSFKDASELIESLKQSEYLNQIENNFNSSPESLSLYYNLLHGPIGVARIQQLILKFLLSKQHKTGIRIAVIERDVPCAIPAVSDLDRLLEKLFVLADREDENQKIECDVFRPSHSESYLRDEAYAYQDVAKLKIDNYDLVLDISLLSRTGIINYPDKISGNNILVIRNSHFTEPTTKNSLISAKSIKYRDIVEVLSNEEYKEMKVAKEALEYFLRLLFRKKNFRVGQLPILDRALKLKSVIGLLPTGGGKSLTYQLAALLQPGITIVVDPIKSLMKDQYDALDKIGISRASFLNSELTTSEKNYVVKSMKHGEEQFLFLSPERYVIESFRHSLSVTNENGHFFSYVVIDEVHCVSEWGHNFRTPYLDLGKNAIEFTKTWSEQNIPLFGLTATASYDVLADIERELKIPEDDGNALVRYENTVRDEINYRIIETPVNFEGKHLQTKMIRNLIGEAKQEAAANWIINLQSNLLKVNNNSVFNAITEQSYESFVPENQKLSDVSFATSKIYQQKQAGILKLKKEHLKMEENDFQLASVVFCPHKNGSHGVYSVNEFLEDKIHDFPSGTFSGGDSKAIAKQSFKNQDLFKGDKLAVMVATKAFGMGIDKPNVRSTIHLNVPESIESFVQEAGRAGRDRRISLSAVLINLDKPIIHKNNDPSNEVVEFWSDYEILDYFHNLSFKGKLKERQTLFELRSKIIFPNIRQISLLEQRLNDSLGGNFISLNLGKGNYLGSIFVNDLNSEDGLGNLELQNLNHRFYAYSGALNQHNVFSILRSLIENSGIIGKAERNKWLNAYTVQSESLTGIEKMLDQMQVGDSETLQIPFRNKYCSGERDDYGKLILSPDHFSFILENKIIRDLMSERALTENYVRAALVQTLNNNGSDIDFIESLGKFNEKLEDELNPRINIKIPSSELEALRRAYYMARTEEDTSKAIYRLVTIGAIDTYTIDYQNKLYVVKFEKKKDGSYFDSLTSLISRYTSDKDADRRINDLSSSRSTDIENGRATEISVCLEYLTDFIYDRIADKRKRAINDMLDLCVRALENSNPLDQNLQIKEEIYYYFNAKYSRKDNCAIRDLEGVDTSVNASLLEEINNPYGEIIRKYLDLLEFDKTALFKDNLKHLRGATMRMLRDKPLPAFFVLKGVTLIILSESSKNLMKEGARELIRGFTEWKKEIPEDDVRKELLFVLEEISKHVRDKRITDRLSEVREAFDILYYSDWLGEFKEQFLINYNYAE